MVDENLPVANSEVCLCVREEDTHLCTREYAGIKAERQRGVGGGLTFYSWEAKIQPQIKKKSERRKGCMWG